jgi:chromosome segregation ATPase
MIPWLKKTRKSSGGATKPSDVEASSESAEAPEPRQRSVSSDTVQTLSRMIKDLEEQLDRMLEINESLEREVQEERRRRAELEQALRERDKALEQADQDSAAVEDLRAQVAHLEGDRARLAASIEEIGRQLAGAEGENRKLVQGAERVRTERDDMLEELQTIETQFNHAMEMVGDLRTRLTVLGEERDAFKGRLKVMDEKLRATEEERDALLAEVDESRKALEEIRRSLAEACATPTR